MGHSMLIQYMYAMCNDHVRVISISFSNIDYFFVMRTFELLSSTFSGMYNKWL
jgi:hypothetical protein